MFKGNGDDIVDIAKGGNAVDYVITKSDDISDLVKPLGEGSTGRTAPLNQIEVDAMKQAMRNPLQDVTNLSEKDLVMKDPRWPTEEGWVKMARNVNDTEIHFVYNKITDEFDDFKFK